MMADSTTIFHWSLNEKCNQSAEVLFYLVLARSALNLER